MTERNQPVTMFGGLWGWIWRPLLWAIPFALFFWVLFGAKREELVLLYEMSLVFAYCIHLALRAARVVVGRVYGCGPAGVEGRAGWQAGSIFLGASVIGSYVAAITIHFTLLHGFLGNWRSVVISGLFTLLFGALFTGINYAIIFYRQAVARARQVEQVRAELAEAELRALRAQINPHFLFNTLNSIAALIAVNPAAAEDVTTRLADVFRYALNASEHEHARLGDELEFVRAYLAIERTRFGERLRVEEAIESGLDSVLVPSLLLQPLVENAVRHGIAVRPEGGRVAISARREGRGVAIEVADDGPGFDGSAPPTGNGFGLHSVRERLRAAGLAGALHIDSSTGHGTRVRIVLPEQPGSPSPDPATKGPTP